MHVRFGERPRETIGRKPDRRAWSTRLHDAFGDGRNFRLFNVLDDLNRDGLAIEVNLSLPSARVIRTLQQVIDWRGKQQATRCDNGPEYISGTLLQWSAERQIRIEYIQPGQPQQNAYVELYNRTVRYDWLAQHIFASMMKSKRLRPLALDVQHRTVPTRRWVGTHRCRT